MSKARAEIEVTASSSKLASGLNAARAKFQTFQSSLARGINATFKGFASGMSKIKLPATASHAIGNFAGNLLTKGTEAIYEAGQGVRDFERDLTRLGIASKMGPEQIDEMRTAIRNLSKETAVSSSDILAATANYVDLTGDVAGASAAMRSFARISQASGASMTDVSGAAAALQDALRIKPDDFEAAFSGLINQGKAGAVSLKDFAGELAALAPKFARFKGATGVEGALQLGAALQVARKGFGSASEAATGLESLMGALSTNAKKFEAAGIKVFDVHKDGSKTFRNLHDIVKAIGASKLAKDPTLLSDAFGRKEAEATFNQLNRLAPLYDEIAEAGKDAGVVERDNATFMESSSGKIDAALNRVKETLAEAFTPERIEAFVEIVEKAAEAIGKVIEGLGEIKDYLTGDNENPYAPEDQVKQEDPGFVDSMLGTGAVMGQRARKAYTSRETRDAMAKIDGPAGEAARAEIADEAAYRKTRDEIKGAGGKEKKIRAAVRAVHDASVVGGDGSQGAAAAGAKYLDQEKVDMGKIMAIREEIAKGEAEAQQTLNNAIGMITTAIRDGFGQAKSPTVQIGDNQVARSVNKATTARTAPKGK